MKRILVIKVETTKEVEYEYDPATCSHASYSSVVEKTSHGKRYIPRVCSRCGSELTARQVSDLF